MVKRYRPKKNNDPNDDSDPNPILDAPLSEPGDATTDDPKTSEEKNKKQVDVIVETAKESSTLFHDASGTAYADVMIKGHRETWPVNSRQFGAFLRRVYWEKKRSAPPSEILNQALRLLESLAVFDGTELEVFLRVAPAPDGGVYLDLCNNDWQAVWIGTTGWSLAKPHGIRFIRRRGMLPLPVPVEGGTVEELRTFINVKNDSDFVLVVAWLLATLRNHGPYPVLLAWGEPGSAKSSLLKMLRGLVDPAVAPLRAPPREDRDLFIAATNAWVVTFDNISWMPDWLSDTLARLATGGGFGTRQLYSDDEERLFDATRPILLGGIENVIIRGDLADRALLIQLGEIPDEERRLERQLWPAFEAAAPRLLGAQGAIVDLVEGNLLASTVSAFVEEEEEWKGTATDLLEALDKKVTETQRKSKVWPKAANALSGKLTRLTGDLRKVGIEIIQAGRDKTTNQKLIEVRKRPLGSLSSLNANNTNDLYRNDRESEIVNDNGFDNDFEAGSLPTNHLKRQPNNDDNDPNGLFRTPRKPRFRNSDERFIYRNGKRYREQEH